LRDILPFPAPRYKRESQRGSAGPAGVGTVYIWRKILPILSFMTKQLTFRTFLFPTALWVWGKNLHGELGDAASVDTNHPITTNFFPSGTTLRRLSAGDGSPLEGSHSLAVDDGHHAFGWGFNSAGQVGNGQFGVDSFIPAQVCGTGQASPCTQFIESVVAVAAGGFHSLALDSFGTVWGWGFNQSGQVGVSSGPVNVPVRNTPLFAQLHQQPGAPVITAIAAGSNHSLALDSRGVVWAWGDNSSGQLGIGSFPLGTPPFIATPVTFPETVKVTAIAAGGRHTLAIDSNGTLWTWGFNQFGQLGLSSFDDHFNTPQKLIHFPANTRIVAIAGGSSHSLALDSIGRVWAFGRNLVGQLGNNTFIDSHGPSKVAFPAGTPKAIGISAGGAHSLAIDSQHRLWAWGLNSNGQLGNPQVGNSKSPGLCQFPQPVLIESTAGGTAHSLALESRSFFFGLEAVLDVGLASATARVIPHSISTSPLTVQTKEEVLKRKSNRRLMTVKIRDAEKHKLELALVQESQNGKLSLELRSLLYNRGKTLKLDSNLLEYEIGTDKAGSVRSLRQHFVLHKKTARLEITARYDARRGETKIHVKSGKHPRRILSRPGMTVIRAGTMSGSIGFSDGIDTWVL
jgi:alpha-tubulin suppressor-like RCC1 family protein